MDPSLDHFPHLEKPPDPKSVPPIDTGTGKHRGVKLAVESKSSKKRSSTGSVLGGKLKSNFVNLNVDHFLNEIQFTQGTVSQTHEAEDTRPDENLVGLQTVGSGVVMKVHPQQMQRLEELQEVRRDEAVSGIEGYEPGGVSPMLASYV
ncbi:hypothetical protein R6Q59_031729 [Mikania micrantha]